MSKKPLVDFETAMVELVPSRGGKRRRELLELLKEYFGDYDATLILNVCLLFKKPGKYSFLERRIRKAMENL